MPIKVIFVKDSEPFPYEIGGILGHFLENLRDMLESGKLNPSAITAMIVNLAQSDENNPQIINAVGVTEGSLEHLLEMLAKTIARIALQSRSPEVVCGKICDSAIRRCRLEPRDASRIVTPDKKIIH